MPGVPAVNPGAVFGSSPVTVHSLTASTEPFSGSVMSSMQSALLVTVTLTVVLAFTVTVGGVVSVVSPTV